MPSTFVFGEFELSAGAFELRFRSERSDVQPKVLKLLLHLIENRDRAVSNEELLRVLWPGETVGATSIRRAIRGARRALRESGDSESSIRTVRGRGYSFVAPVRVSEIDSSGEAERARGGFATDAFLGRESQIGLLESYVQDALRGEGRVVLLLGEAGIGKTRTIRELCLRIRALDVDAWACGSMEEDGAPAFYPWLKILRQCLRDRGLAEVGAGAADLVQALPELTDLLGTLRAAPRINASQSRFRFFESTVNLLKSASKRRAIVLLFDDLHRADLPTLRLLGCLIRHLGDARILVLASLRSIRGKDARATDLLHQIARDEYTRHVELDRLSSAHLAAYFERAVGEAAPAEVVASLHHQTAGNPLFWRLILDVFHAERQGASPPDWEWFRHVPHTRGLMGAVERHLDTLPEPCRDLLQAASVLGREFSIGVLADMVGLTPATAVQHLSEALATGIVRAAPATAGRYRFSHLLLRDVLYGKLAAADKARLHGSAGLVIESHTPGASGHELVELAHHFMAAAPAYDAGRALPYCLRTAEAAARRLAYEEASQALDQALVLLDFGVPNAGQRMQILLDKADALTGAGDAAGAREAFLAVAAAARALSAPDGLIRAAIGVGRPPETGSVDEERVSLLKEARAVADASDARLPLLQALLAKALTYSGENAEARRLAGEAVASARAGVDPAVLGETLRQSYLLSNDLRYLAERRKLSDEIVTLAHRTGDQELLWSSQITSYQTALEEGDVERVDAAIDTLETLFSENRQPLVGWYAIQFRALRAMLDGELIRAEELARSAFDLGQCAGEQARQHVYFVQLYSIRVAQGRFIELERMVRLGASRYPTLSAWRAAVASLDAELGQTQRALQELRLLMQRRPLESSKDPLSFNALPAVAELCALVEDEGSAGPLYEALLPVGHQYAIIAHGIAMRGPVARNLGMLALCLKEFARAETHLEQALDMAERLRSPPMIGFVYYDMARLHILRGRRGARALGTELLGRAAAIGDALGIGALSAKCRRAASGLSLQLEPVDSTALSG